MFHQITLELKTVLIASSVTADGIEYRADMVISAGLCSGLRKFKISQTVAVNLSLFGHTNFTIWMSELNEVFPLPCYIVKGRMVVTPKHYILS